MGLKIILRNLRLLFRMNEQHVEQVSCARIECRQGPLTVTLVSEL
jgi:hypothetical protein